MAAIPLLSGPQDPSQFENTINTLIVQINAGASGSSPYAAPTAQTTGSAITGFGAVTVNTTTRTAGTTGRYTIAAPVPGRTVTITSLSTVKATITGLFSRGKTKLSLTTTAAVATAKLPSVILRALSTSAWSVSASFGPVTST